MRYLYIALVVVIAAVVILFNVQNVETVSVSLFSFSVAMPTWLMVYLVYFAGMLTGGFVLAFMRKTLHGASRSKP